MNIYTKLIENFQLGIFLTKSEFQNNYEKSFLGVLWFFSQPISYILPWVLLEKLSLFSPGNMESSSFFNYSMRNLIYWTFFQVNLSYSRSTLTQGRFIYQQINYDHTIFLYKGLIRSFIQIIFLFFLFSVFHYSNISFLTSGLSLIVLIPVLLIAWAIGLQLCLIDTISVEMKKIGDVIVIALFWITPIVYLPSSGSYLEVVSKYNPLTHLLRSFQSCLEISRSIDFNNFSIFLSLSLVLFFYSYKVFELCERKLFQRILE